MSLLESYGAYTGEWLMQQEFPPTSYVVDGLIPEGLTYIIAAPKIGKSWMVLDLAISVSQGTPFLGAIPVEPRPVLYLALEDGQKRIQKRAHVLNSQTLPSNITFIHHTKPGDALAVMREFTAEHEGEQPLIVLDTLGKVKPAKAPGSGAYEHDYMVSAQLKTVADESDGSVVVVHHNRKAGSDDFLEDVSGTQGIAGAADTIIVVRRSRTEAEAELHVTSRDAAEGSYAAVFDNGKWTLAGGQLSEAATELGLRRSQENLGDDSAQVIDLVRQHPDGVRAVDIAESLGWSQHKAGTYLSRLGKAGKINKAARGLYTPVESVGSVDFTDSEWTA